jgi:hypothetical protein
MIEKYKKILRCVEFVATTLLGKPKNKKSHFEVLRIKYEDNIKLNHLSTGREIGVKRGEGLRSRLR